MLSRPALNTGDWFRRAEERCGGGWGYTGPRSKMQTALPAMWEQKQKVNTSLNSLVTKPSSSSLSPISLFCSQIIMIAMRLLTSLINHHHSSTTISSYIDMNVCLFLCIMLAGFEIELPAAEQKLPASNPAPADKQRPEPGSEDDISLMKWKIQRSE